MNNRWKPRNEYILFGGEKLKEDFGRKQQKYPNTKNVIVVERGPEPMRTEEWHDVKYWNTDRGGRWTRPEDDWGALGDGSWLGHDGRWGAAADKSKSWIHYVSVPKILGGRVRAKFWGKIELEFCKVMRIFVIILQSVQAGNNSRVVPQSSCGGKIIELR